VSEMTLTLGDAARMMRESLKDRSYRSTPLGLEVARYYRWKKNEWGAADDTLRDYEPILAKLATFFADLCLADFTPPVGTERLRECWDYHWGDRAPRTRKKVRSVWVDFFDWAVRERGLHGNPARALATPKGRGVKRDPFAGGVLLTLLNAQTYLADRLGCELIVKYALRRAELAAVRFNDFDFERQRLTVTGKGGKVRLTPIIDPAFWRDLAALQLEIGAAPEHALLYRLDRRKVRCGPADAEETLQLGSGRFAYYRLREVRDHTTGVVPRSVHTWWYRCLERAGLVDEDVQRGLNMHRGRHTVASDILRRSGNIVAAQQMLGHADIKTTVESYAQFDDADLEAVLRQLAEEETS
jgi:site-specific recombinase XerC